MDLVDNSFILALVALLLALPLGFFTFIATAFAASTMNEERYCGTVLGLVFLFSLGATVVIFLMWFIYLSIAIIFTDDPFLAFIPPFLLWLIFLFPYCRLIRKIGRRWSSDN